MEAMSASIGTLSAALAKAQGQMTPAIIDGSAKIATKTGSSYGYTYSSLTSVWNAIRKPLADNELAIIQRIDDENGVMFLYTILTHSSGEYITSRLSIGSVGRPAQETGSAITYSRRYALSAMVGVVTDEDDDGDAATKGQREQPKKQAPAKPQPNRPGAKELLRDLDGIEAKHHGHESGQPPQDNTPPLPFRASVEGAIEWACKTAPQVWPTHKDGSIVEVAVENSFRKLQTQGLTGRELLDAWITKVNDKLATWKASQASETTDDGWAEVDAAGHDADEPQFS